MKKKTEKKVEEQPNIQLGAVPNLYNAEMLKWQRVHFNALKAIYDKLEEILQKE